MREELRNTNPRRGVGVVILSNRSLVAAATQRLLEGMEDLDLCVVGPDDPEASVTISQQDPQAIIVDTGDPTMQEGLAARLLRQHPHAKVIALNVDEHDIKVYRVEQVLQADLAGLLQAIRGRGSAAKRGSRPKQREVHRQE